MRLERSYKRQQRKKAGLLPSSTGFKSESQPTPSLEQEFRSQHVHRPKPFKPPY
jgi:hypothetical protein